MYYEHDVKALQLRQVNVNLTRQWYHYIIFFKYAHAFPMQTKEMTVSVFQVCIFMKANLCMLAYHPKSGLFQDFR